MLEPDRENVGIVEYVRALVVVVEELVRVIPGRVFLSSRFYLISSVTTVLISTARRRGPFTTAERASRALSPASGFQLAPGIPSAGGKRGSG